MTNTTPHLISIQMREEHRDQNYYYAHYSHGITTILNKEDPIVQQWISEGNEPLPPDPTPEPEPLTAQQKLEAAGLTVEELRGLLGL